ncbi:MAG: hypothetical protein O3B95_08535 [Chloroflexi bacterium]|nr:hypothetical protein [Chloroflexota bacterium]
MPRIRDYERLTFEVASAVFALVEVNRGPVPVDEAQAEAQRASGRSYDRRTISPLLQLAKHLMLRRAINLPPLTSTKDARELTDTNTVGYGVSPSWVLEKSIWYYQRLLEISLAREKKVKRLSGLLDRMSVPAYRNIPGDLLHGDGSFHAREIEGSRFRWKDASRESGVNSSVERAWYDNIDHTWLVEEVIGDLPEPSRGDLASRYQSIQKEVCEYLTAATTNHSELERGSPSLLTVNVEEIHGGELALQLGGPPYPDGVQHGLYLYHEPARLQELVIGFVDSLTRAFNEL